MRTVGEARASCTLPLPQSTPLIIPSSAVYLNVIRLVPTSRRGGLFSLLLLLFPVTSWVPLQLALVSWASLLLALGPTSSWIPLLLGLVPTNFWASLLLALFPAPSWVPLLLAGVLFFFCCCLLAPTNCQILQFWDKLTKVRTKESLTISYIEN